MLDALKSVRLLLCEICCRSLLIVRVVCVGR